MTPQLRDLLEVIYLVLITPERLHKFELRQQFLHNLHKVQQGHHETQQTGLDITQAVHTLKITRLIVMRIFTFIIGIHTGQHTQNERFQYNNILR